PGPRRPRLIHRHRVFEDKAALDRQESLPEVKKTLAILEESLAAAPEATLFHVASSEPWGG
ncbi:MAG: hypothetical protein ACRDJB_08980, partial [Actinomycetota bacterium]